MSKKLLLLAAIGLFASCKKSNNSNPENPVPETIKEMNFTITGPKSFSSAPVQQGTGKFNFLGYGYNIIGKYADTSSVRAQVINTSAYATAYPGRIDFSSSTSSGFTSLYAENAEDYSRKISMNLKETEGMKLFKNSITTVFPGQDAISNKYIYAQNVYAMNWKSIRTYWDNGEGYLTSEFSVDVQNLTPENLVKKYGTHILSGIVLGEKLNVYFQAKSSDNDKLHSSIVGFTYALKQVFGFMSGYADPLKPAEVNAISEPKLVYEAIGGDPSKVNKVVTDKRTLIRSNDWFPTCTEDKALFIDIIRLTPLYDMIVDPVKKAEVKSYITSYMEQNQVKI
ncbi:hypothetical protein HH214_04580 [Mucilaginibacter robiniae]|uniref:MACPF domain-containing protein n=1 Tax=Mucilaginibacter robiniae TaxID=2728022 RepID=A0A7L5E0Y5_9SPHI|nr:hypothetical protein [Mucilaginibacter robiniae]QJD95204.1 hypothetical protein HH214_04580 [Mucilaginibacter robiniae]